MLQMQSPGDNSLLTVHNGLDDKVALSAEVIGEASFPEISCDPNLQSSPELRHRHRNLVLGEKITAGGGEQDGNLAELLNNWCPNGLSPILNIAVNTMKDMDSADFFENTKLPLDDKHLYSAVGLLRLFVQLNYTGPDITSPELSDKLEKLSLERLSPEKKSILLPYLELDGIEHESSCRTPILLLLAKHFISSLKNEQELWPFYVIWRFRIEFLHQRALLRRSASLARKLKFFADQYIQWRRACEDSGNPLGGDLADIDVVFLCEISEMLVYYHDSFLSERFLNEAKTLLGINIDFTGKMGFRTNFQQQPTSQIAVNIHFKPETDISSHANSEPVSVGAMYLPQSQPLNDDTRLDRVRFVDEDTNSFPCKGSHQLVLLGLLVQKLTGQTEHDKLQKEALINVILDYPVTWTGRLTALVRRCYLEKLDRRAIDRCHRQCQEILHVTAGNDVTQGTSERHYLFFGSGHPTRTEVKTVFGEVLLLLENWKEAMDLYKGIGSFEELLLCYQMMNLRHKGEDMIRQKIMESGETPKLLVLLGDHTSDISHYERAWVLSSEKSFESQLRLGTHYYQRQDFKQAAFYFTRAVELAPLEYPCWVKLAWSTYKSQDYDASFKAYLHAANMEYDSFHVWNNLGNCALQLNRKEYALRAYNIAVKCSYDEWRVWNNILVVSTELGKVSESIFAYHRILDLNKNFSNEAVLEEMVNLVTEPKPPLAATIASMAKLMGRITSMMAKSPGVVHLYGRLLLGYINCKDEDCDESTKCTNFERAMDFYAKSISMKLQNPSWKTDLVQLEDLVHFVIEFRTERLRTPPTSNDLVGPDRTFKLAVKTIEGALKNVMLDAPGNEKLKNISDILQIELTNNFYKS